MISLWPTGSWRSWESHFSSAQAVYDRTQVEFKRDSFSYQSDQDAYLCPQGKTLRLNGLYRSASGLFWQYKAEKADCICCPVRGKCLSEHDRRGARKLEDSYFKPLSSEVGIDKVQMNTGKL